MIHLARAAIAALTLLASGAAAAPAATTPQAREVTTLSDGWRFKFDSGLSGAEAPAFADADWSTVKVPHTWNRVGYYLNDPASHANRADNVNTKLGVGWYRLHFNPPARLSGRRLWLEFDAASRERTSIEARDPSAFRVRA